jgi:hypothetical protein
MHPTYTNELVRCLTGEAFAAAPSHILESLDEALAHREFSGVPRTIYAELWHIAFWQQPDAQSIARGIGISFRGRHRRRALAAALRALLYES